MTSPALERIDAHHHLWHYVSSEYEWIDDSMSALKRDFLLDDLKSERQAAEVSGTVVVQARQSVAETDWLLSIARESPEILGVVGWLPLADKDCETLLDRFGADRKLKGLRHVVQAESPGFLDDPDFNRGIRSLTQRGLTYDLLIIAAQLKESLRFIDRHPQQSFVIDHIAKPSLDELNAWAADIRDFAKRPNVACKISGMVTELGGQQWTASQLEPYFDVVLETFGPDRLMVGTDWPVLTLACGYGQWWQTVAAWIAPLSSSEQAKILAGTAARFYSLSPVSNRGAQ